MTPRVKAGIWVSMALRMGNNNGRYGAVLRKGDADAGGVLVVLSGRSGMCVLNQVSTAAGDACWMRATGADPVDQDNVDAYVARRVKADPDLWVIEFESPDMLPPFEAKII